MASVTARMWPSLKAPWNAEPRWPEVPKATRSEATSGLGSVVKNALTRRGTLMSAERGAGFPGTRLVAKRSSVRQRKKPTPRRARRTPYLAGSVEKPGLQNSPFRNESRALLSSHRRRRGGRRAAHTFGDATAHSHTFSCLHDSDIRKF